MITDKKKTKFERLKEVLPINIGDTVYYCTSDEEDEFETTFILFQSELRVIGVLQAPKENEDCAPIFILYDPITNLAHVRLAVWKGSMILQTKELMDSPELRLNILSQYGNICTEFSYV